MACRRCEAGAAARRPPPAARRGSACDSVCKFVVGRLLIGEAAGAGALWAGHLW